MTLAGRPVRLPARQCSMTEAGPGDESLAGPEPPLTERAQVLSLSGNLHIIDLDVAVI